MGIPAIVKAAITPQNVRDNDTVILDGETGRLGYSRMRSPAWIYCNAPKHGGNKGIVS